MLKNKVNFAKYGLDDMFFRRAIAKHFKHRQHNVENGFLYFNMKETDFGFLNDHGLEFVVEANL